MAKMKAAMAAWLVMEKEGVTQAFGVPGAAINPLYAQLRKRQSIAHRLNLRDVKHGGFMVVGDVPLRLSTVHITDKGKPLYDYSK